ncbi:MAG: carbohydrate ABC transporter permease [Clostridia bacterium]|nr:carbohydrate ABC transporter permease [Clostridia bacterium]MBP3360246.1 carbohydrate ABC transporter permease [Clostridia bacterium]
MQNDKSTAYRIGSTINFVVMAIVCIAMLYPFIYILALSFNDGMDAMKGGIYFFPRKFTLDNYKEAFKNEELVNAFTISVLRTVIGTVVHLFLRATVGFALSRKQLWGRTGFTFFFYFTTLVGGGMIPTYILYRQLHLLNNFLIYILPGIYGFFDLVMLRTYFSTIPDSLEEAAYIDGSTPMQTFFKVYLPLSMPILATLALFSAVGQWNEWFTGSFYITDTKLQPAATLLQKLINELDLSEVSEQQVDEAVLRKTTPEALRNAFIIIMTAPILCVYPFLQKYFVKGVMIGSVKG